MTKYEIGTEVVLLDDRHPNYYGWSCRVIRHQQNSEHFHVVEAINGNHFNGQSGNLWGAKNGTLESADIYNSPLWKALS